MPLNPYEPPSGETDNRSPESLAPDGDRDSLDSPALAYTASSNLEAHSVVTWLRSNGVRAYAVEDHSGAGLFAFGMVNPIHKPQVFVDKRDLGSTGDLLREYETQRDQRRQELDNKPPISAECEDCGVSSEFPASQDGTTQTCPKCHAFIDVGTIDWPEDFDFSEGEEASDQPILNVDEALDAALRLDNDGDWDEAIAAYLDIAQRWPEHASYVANCVSMIERKIDVSRHQ